MTMDEGRAFENLTFSQRSGIEPLPEPMQLEELSTHLRREIWNLIRQLLLAMRKSGGGIYYFLQNDKRFIERVLGRFMSVPEDEISTIYDSVIANFKTVVIDGTFNRVLDLLEIIANDRRTGADFTGSVEEIFEEHAAPYVLDTSHYKYFFRPRSSKEQGIATKQAMETLQSENMEGAVVHLREAAEHINAGQYGDAITDSILAVESVARTIDPKASQTLGPALNSLEQFGLLKHPALKKAFSVLYGYTNDAQGIRHALVDKGTRDVGVDEATFMYGACASFCAYLAGKHRKSK